MRIRKQQSGFAVLELVLVIVIIAAIVVAGLWVYNRNKSGNGTETASTTPTTSTQSPVAHNVSTAPTINSTSDLDKALATLNQNNPATTNSSDQSQLDSQASF